MVGLARNSSQELNWIDDDSSSNRPSYDDSSRGPEAFKDKLVRKVSQNWLVPIGLIATTACLTLGLFNLKRGDSRKQQFYMRGRVLCQGLTFLAMTAGVVTTAIKGIQSQSSDEKELVQQSSD